MKRLLLAFAIMATLVGCSKSEEDSDPTVSKLEVIMNVSGISNDVLDYFDVEFNYVDFNGNSSQNAITQAKKFTFSIDNPALGEESSTPFTAELKFTQKDTLEKASGNYDSSLSWQLDVNAYDKKGNLITDSGLVQSRTSTDSYSSLANFVSYITSQASMTSITYKTFFCKTLSGEWHIGVEGTENRD